MPLAYFVTYTTNHSAKNNTPRKYQYKACADDDLAIGRATTQIAEGSDGAERDADDQQQADSVPVIA